MMALVKFNFTQEIKFKYVSLEIYIYSSEFL